MCWAFGSSEAAAAGGREAGLEMWPGQFPQPSGTSVDCGIPWVGGWDPFFLR